MIVQTADGQQRRVHKSSVKPAAPGSVAGYGTTAPMAPPVGQDVNGTWHSGSGAVEGSSAAAVPPTYAEAVKGDHKVQTRD